LRISFLPAAADDTASSRIRVYSLLASMARAGWSADVGFDSGADVVVVQKKVTGEILEQAARAKSRGAAVVYDVDDLGSALDYWAAPEDFDRILELSDVVTTDTAGHRELLLRDHAARSVEIVPDCVDYYPAGPSGLAELDDAPLRVMWFGSIGNIELFQRYAATLLSVREVEVVVVTGAASVRDYAARHPGIRVLPWSRPGFVDVLRACHLTCLMHDGSEIDRTKSNNKMITSISWGVPALVSRTAEFARTAREASVEDALFGDDGELRAAVERFRTPASRAGYLARAQAPIWERYRPDAVARALITVLESLVHEPHRV